MMRRLFLVAAGLALAAGVAVVPATVASAHTPPPPPKPNPCVLWANPVLHPHYPHCYANLHP